ncbi:MAG: hypothetical protein VX756_04900 [Bacteroidota bacterium]|nr:hypothetical protein [Bacteroidota bacterium]
MPKIIQFLHTSVEATPENTNDTEIPWNNHTNHRRKFILSKGKYAKNGNYFEDNLVYWGEWEAQSKIEKLKNYKSHLPSFLNMPFLDPSVPERTHNTDPYVFGQNFRYIVCKQGFFEVLRRLDPFSLILFGSCINKKFCLDTLFVVSEKKFNYNIENIENVFQEKNQYYYASVNPLYDDTKFNNKVEQEDNCRIEKGNNYSFYKGVNFEEKKEYKGIFSYVPCKKFNSEKETDFVFKQPAIELDFIVNNQTQGLNACNGKDFTIQEIIEYWNKISEIITSAGLLHGVYFKTPPLNRG